MIGTQLENYRVLERIGEGGMGAVYRAFDVMLERDVALKFLHPDLARQPELVERFRTEAVVLARLMHPNIAHVHGLHRHHEEFYMAMEYVPGHTLSDLVKRNGRMPLARAVRVVVDVLGALEYAHRQGVVHRDIKTANVIVTPDGTVKVMDFGIARVLGSDRRTRAGTIVGTLGYMSPEQIQGFEVDGRTDLYSLGIVLFELLTGRVPFEAETEWKLMQAQIEQPPPLLRAFVDVPLSLEDAVIRALAKAPGERFQSAVEFQQAIVGLAAPPAGAVAATTSAGREHRADQDAAPGADDTTMPGSERWNVSVRTIPPSSSADATRLATPPPGSRQLSSVAEAPRPAAPEVRSALATPAPAVRKTTAATRGSRRAVIAVALVGAIAAATAAGWLWLTRVGTGGSAADQAEQASTSGDVMLPLAPPAPGPAESAPAAPVPPPPPEPVAVGPASPKAPSGGVSVGASAKVAQPPSGGSSGTGRAAARSVPATPATTSVAEAGATPVIPAAPPAAAVTEALAPVRFDRVKLVRRTSNDTEIEVDGVLALEAGRLIVFNVTGRNALKAFDLPAITAARYSESSQTRVFVRTRRYRLLLTAGGEITELRLDRGNAPQVVEAFEKRWGRSVARGDDDWK